MLAFSGVPVAWPSAAQPFLTLCLNAAIWHDGGISNDIPPIEKLQPASPPTVRCGLLLLDRRDVTSGREWISSAN
jgi:hypothetical protein